ncbi:cobalamin B12-binding domain-containing protein [Rhodoferax lacus]|uniref:cobalamin B12-binding domain-containing protein n=1 Tax=Rhodoferax lacus TaxID=2184758 RepID=UPI0011C13C2C|nr:cobalamin B12-binding domain-containing protein [Rhodoferax lacus]
MNPTLSAHAFFCPVLGGEQRSADGPTCPLLPLGAPALPFLQVQALQVQTLAEACWQSDGQPVALLQSWALAGLDWEEIYLQGVVPAAQLLGQWWLADRLDFVAVSVASTRLQQALYDLSPTFLAQAREAHNGLNALLFCNPGSQHSMGVFMLGEFFRKSGWRVSGLPLQSHASALRSVQSDWFDVAGLSVSTNRCLDALGYLIQGLRTASANPALKIMVGGPMAILNRGLLLSLGADFIGGDARESQRLALRYVKEDPRCKAEYSPCNSTIDTTDRSPVLTTSDRQAASSKPISLPNRWP